MVNEVYDAACLELGDLTAPLMAVTIFLQSIGNNPITYENAFPPINKALILQRQVKCVEDIIVTI